MSCHMITSVTEESHMRFSVTLFLNLLFILGMYLLKKHREKQGQHHLVKRRSIHTPPSIFTLDKSKSESHNIVKKFIDY